MEQITKAMITITLSVIFGITFIVGVHAISGMDWRDTDRIDGLFNDIQANTGTINSLSIESLVTTYLYAYRFNMNNGAFNVQGNHIWNSFSGLGIVIDDTFKVSELETGNNTGTPLCVDVNNYLCRCGFCA